MTNFHVALGMIQSVETELFVELLRVLRDQRPTTNSRQIGMIENRLDQTFAETAFAKGFENDHVRQISVSRVVSDGAGETDLFFTAVNAESQ